MLDYILCNRLFFNNVNKYCILEEGIFSFIFDYFLVLMFIDLYVKYNYFCKNRSLLLVWYKVDVN